MARWAAKPGLSGKLLLVEMATAGFMPTDYWDAGIHFNDNGWCKMAKVRLLARYVPAMLCPCHAVSLPCCAPPCRPCPAVSLPLPGVAAR